ncbi:hypothetical protein GZH53_18455 [Flavihumibacter sp. R14]|nr:hypothetical protein [Flavihumibacter soli]
MIKIFKNIAFAAFLLSTVSATAQNTSSSPYSQFGLGELRSLLLPQNKATGLSNGFRKPGPYSNINLSNPASYSAIQLTTFDIGLTTDLRQLSKGDISENSFNATLNHLAIGVPVNAKSAISFGLLPVSLTGYEYKNSGTVAGSKVDYIYSGDGGLSKAYLGYGFGIGKNLNFGFNAGYLFGNIKHKRSAEFPEDLGALNSRIEEGKSVSGLSFDYGLQYEGNLSKTTKLVIGYSGNAGSDLTSKNVTTTTRYTKDFSVGNESPALDTTFTEGETKKLHLPLSHSFGFAFQKTDYWLVGADVSYARWSDFRSGTDDPGLNDTYGFAVGGQFTPDPTSVSNYFKLVEYRFGFKYDKTYVNINNYDIDQYGLTFGLGLPLQSNRSTFYRVNFAAEIGQRGTLENNLIRERYLNLTLGFTMNDRWFIKPKFD